MESIPPNIFAYYDYHRYLLDAYEFRKATHSYFSYRYISGKVGIDHALVVKIFQGHRHLGMDKVPQFATLLGLKKREAEYFELMVLYGRAKTDGETRRYFEQMLSYAELGSRQLDKSQYEFYQKWYYTAIREILHFYPFDGDYAALARQVTPTITVSEARKAVELLLELNLVEKGPDGCLSLTSRFITTGEEWRTLAVRTFQKETLDIAKQALESIPKEMRDISTLTITMDAEALEKIRERIRQFHREVFEIVDQSGKVDRAYQVNIQVFPLSKLPAKTAQEERA